jgi:hypothetical protein
MAFIEGYANRISVAPGDSIAFHVSTDAPQFKIEVLRDGAEPTVLTTVEAVKGVQHAIPAEAWANGCAWPAAHTLVIPAEWSSGVYRARLTAAKRPSDFTQWCSATVSHDIFFIVRSSQPGVTAPILMHLCTNTYNAYNKWGGHSLYGYHSIGKMRSARVSLNRPGIGFYGDYAVTRWELPFIAWAERNGIKLDYASNCDLERHPELLEKYKLIISVGHDEYWSWGMRDHLENFIGNGGNAAFFAGNAVCWQVRFEEEGRVMRCHKESSDEDPIFMTGDRRKLSARWIDKYVQRPENSLTGVGWDQGGYHRSHEMHMDGSGAYTVKRADHWVFEGTELKDGDNFGGADTIVGYECDGCAFILGADGRPVPTGSDGTPKNFQILAQAPAAQFAGHEGYACLGMYTRGGTVFTAATTDWADGLRDPIVQRITSNVLRKLSR